MAYSIYTAYGDGSTTQFAISFGLGYIDKADVKCRVNKEVDGLGQPVYRSLTWITDSLVQVGGTVPATGQLVEFIRTVSKTSLVHDYSDGVEIQEKHLDDSNKQTLMAVQEVLDGRFESGLATDLNVANNRLINLADGIAPQDAATVAQLGGIPAFVAAAAASASTASTQATNASNSASAAAVSETNAAASAARLAGTSTSSVAIGTGSKSFVTQAGKFFDVGNFVLITDTANSANYMWGAVTAYTGTALTINVITIGGSGTKTSWTIKLSGERGATGATGPAGITDGDKGDVTVSGSGSVFTIDSGAVTYAKIQNVSGPNKLLGTASGAGAMPISEITCNGIGRDVLAATTMADARSAIGASSVLKAKSTAIAMTLGGTGSFTHGLGADPDLWYGILKCTNTTGSGGAAIGDEITVCYHGYSTAGIQIYKNGSTSISWRIPSGGLIYNNVTLTLSSFELYLVAIKF